MLGAGHQPTTSPPLGWCDHDGWAGLTRGAAAERPRGRNAFGRRRRNRKTEVPDWTSHFSSVLVHHRFFPVPLFLEPFSRDPMLRVSRETFDRIATQRRGLIKQLALPGAPKNLLLFLYPDGATRIETGLRARPTFGLRQPLLVMDLSPRTVCMLQSRSLSSLPGNYLRNELIPPLPDSLEHSIWSWLWLGNCAGLYAHLSLTELLDLKRTYLIAKEPEGRSSELDLAIKLAVTARIRNRIGIST